MDPTTVFAPIDTVMPEAKRVWHISIHSRKEQRFICHECQKTFSARKGTGLLSVAHLGRDRGHRGDLARPWVSPASDCGRFWV